MGRPKNLQSEELLAGFRDGQESSFKKVFEMLYPSNLYYAFQITQDQSAAEDIVEESFVKIWAKRGQMENIKVLKSYLYVTIRNGAFNWQNLRKRQNNMEKDLEMFGEHSDRSVLEGIVHAEVLQQIYTVLDRLPTACRRIMRMAYIEGMTTRKIAETLKLTVGTIKTQRTKGISVIRKNLGDLK